MSLIRARYRAVNTIMNLPSPSGAPLFDPDYQAVLDYATTQGYTLPSEAQQTLQNQLVLDLKSAGVWSKLDSFALFATDGDSDFALIDWIQLNTYTASNSPTFTADQGFTGNGTSQFITTSVTTSNYTQDSASQGVWLYALATNSNYHAGGSLNRQRASNSTFNRINSTNNASSSINFNLSTGLQHLNRSDSTNIQAYVNGSLQVAATQTSTGLSSGFVVMARTNSGVGLSDGQYSMHFLGGDLSSEASDFYDAMNTYMSAL